MWPCAGGFHLLVPTTFLDSFYIYVPCNVVKSINNILLELPWVKTNCSINQFLWIPNLIHNFLDLLSRLLQELILKGFFGFIGVVIL
jgi:hypothetical protein